MQPAVDKRAPHRARGDAVDLGDAVADLAGGEDVPLGRGRFAGACGEFPPSGRGLVEHPHGFGGRGRGRKGAGEDDDLVRLRMFAGFAPAGGGDGGFVRAVPHDLHHRRDPLIVGEVTHRGEGLDQRPAGVADGQCAVRAAGEATGPAQTPVAERFLDQGRPGTTADELEHFRCVHG